MKVLLFFVMLSLSGASWAQFFDGNKLLALCATTAGSYDEGRCIGFIVGVADSIVASVNRREISRRVCMPRTVTDPQLKAVVVDYLHLVPQLRGYVATFLVEMALRRKYPCGS